MRFVWKEYSCNLVRAESAVYIVSLDVLKHPKSVVVLDLIESFLVELVVVVWCVHIAFPGFTWRFWYLYLS